MWCSLHDTAFSHFNRTLTGDGWTDAQTDAHINTDFSTCHARTASCPYEAVT